MRHIANAPAPAAPPRPKAPARRWSTECAGCEIVRYTPLPALPKDWSTEKIGGEVHAFCPECSDGGAA